MTTPELTDEQADQFLKNSGFEGGGIAVTLTAAKWQELLGMTTQGVQLILSQLSMQQGGLPQVAQLSTAADQLLNEIKEQLPQ